MGGSQSAPTPTSDEIEAVRDRKEMVAMVANITLSPSEQLFDSCWKGDPKAVKRNLKQGAVVDWAHHLNNGRTALHAAAFSGNLECCELLISAGATVNYEDADGKTPKDWAILAGLEEVAVMIDRWQSQMPPSRGGSNANNPDQYTRKLKEKGPTFLTKDRPSHAPRSRTVGSRMVL